VRCEIEGGESIPLVYQKLKILGFKKDCGGGKEPTGEKGGGGQFSREEWEVRKLNFFCGPLSRGGGGV